MPVPCSPFPDGFLNHSGYNPRSFPRPSSPGRHFSALCPHLASSLFPKYTKRVSSKGLCIYSSFSETPPFQIQAGLPPPFTQVPAQISPLGKCLPQPPYLSQAPFIHPILTLLHLPSSPSSHLMWHLLPPCLLLCLVFVRLCLYTCSVTTETVFCSPLYHRRAWGTVGAQKTVVEWMTE